MCVCEVNWQESLGDISTVMSHDKLGQSCVRCLFVSVCVCVCVCVCVSLCVCVGGGRRLEVGPFAEAVLPVAEGLVADGHVTHASQPRRPSLPREPGEPGFARHAL